MRKRNIIKRVVEFAKLQLAGNILFWGTYGGYFLSDVIFHKPNMYALAVASLVAHCLFFIASRDWVFDDKGAKKTGREIWRFILFMGMNYFINLGIIGGLEIYFDISPYIGQFISGFFFTFWSYIGLKFWVFEPQHVKHPAITYHSTKRGKKSHARRSTK